MNIKEAQLGRTFNADALLNQTHAIWGGVSWPGEREGYAVVVAAGTERHFENYDLYVLDEFESSDTREIVRQCAAMNVKYAIPRPRGVRQYSCGRWIGDYKDDAADRFIRQMNNEIKPGAHTPRFSLNFTAILEMDKVYPFILPEIRELVRAVRRQLFLKGSKVVDYLKELDGDEISELKLGDYPAIEALAFVVIELRSFIKMQESLARRPRRSAYQDWRPSGGRRRRMA